MNETTNPASTAWYRETWPWFIIALLGSCIVACFVTLALAIVNPDSLVMNENEYQALRAELRQSGPATEPKAPDLQPKPDADDATD